MATFIITGDCDDVCAKLKNTLRASDAGFDATLEAAFKTKTQPAARPVAKAIDKPAAKPMSAPPMPARQPVAPAADARGGFGSGSPLSLTRNRDDSGNMRSRLRSSLRSTPR